MLDAGGRVETVSNANLWTVNSNIVTFNGDLSFQATFNSTSDYTYEDFWYVYGVSPSKSFGYWLVPEYCNFDTYTAVITVTGQRVIDPTTFEVYGSTSLNPYGLPLDIVSIPGSATISPDQKTMSVSLYPVPSGTRVWWSLYSEDTYFSEDNGINIEEVFGCPAGYDATRSAYYQLDTLATVPSE
jgi:hypothetical protein